MAAKNAEVATYLDADERLVVLMALAMLSVERPAMRGRVERVARRLGASGSPGLFDALRGFYRFYGADAGDREDEARDK